MEKYKSEGKSVVYIDESGFSHESPRSHGYAKIGKRCFGTFNWGAKGRTNAIGALLNGLLLTVSLFSFNVNSDVFHAWMTQDLMTLFNVFNAQVVLRTITALLARFQPD